MKQSGYKLGRWRLLWINLVNTYQTDTAYWTERWGGLASTLFYNVSYLIFLHAIFSNVKTLAGYTQNEMIFLILMGELGFFVVYFWSWKNTDILIQDINRGNLDIMLTRPIPSLFYVLTRQLTIVKIVRDGLPPIILLSWFIQWSQLGLTPESVLAGVIVYVAGQVAMNAFIFMVALPVFWLGQGREVMMMLFPLLNHEIPFEGLSRGWQTFFTSVVPSFIMGVLTTSVMLGKSDPWTTVGYVATVAVVISLVRYWAWRMALRAYTSASS